MSTKSLAKVFPAFFWALKVGAVSNLFFFVQSFQHPLKAAPPGILIPARILFLVSAYRCLFPVRYKDYIVLHDSPLSSIFITRTLATFSEIALIYQLSYTLRAANLSGALWIDGLAWMMVILVIISQFFVWGSILTGDGMLFVSEELGWFLIYLINTSVTIFLYATLALPTHLSFLLTLNMLFGIFYLPWQVFHLRSLSRAAGEQHQLNSAQALDPMTGLKQAIRIKNPSLEPADWGGLMGLIWMGAYWAAVIPVWAYLILLKL